VTRLHAHIEHVVFTTAHVQANLEIRTMLSAQVHRTSPAQRQHVGSRLINKIQIEVVLLFKVTSVWARVYVLQARNVGRSSRAALPTLKEASRRLVSKKILACFAVMLTIVRA
jgi:hypothetical protein